MASPACWTRRTARSRAARSAKATGTARTAGGCGGRESAGPPCRRARCPRPRRTRAGRRGGRP
ncbi:hypothetical protein NKH77_07465 [Streptomyces sp. M19]